MTFKEYIEREKISTDITFLNCSSSNLIDLIGIESFKNLEWLACSKNNLTDLKGIENLIDLSHLHCDNNLLIDLKGIENLIDLKLLKCYNNEITSLKPIDRLKKITCLISDLADNIEEARELIKTEIRRDKISDIE